MAQDPNPNVTIPGSGVLLHVLNPSGEPIPVQGDADGAIETTGGGGGGGGAVTQSTGATATPWYMQGVNGGVAERLATAAKQPALGTAGTASTDVITVQGIASGTALNVDTELPPAAALSDSTANPTAPMVGSAVMGFSGTGFAAGGNVWKRIPGNEVGLAVQGYTQAGGSAGQYYPVVIGGTTSTNVVARLLVGASGHPRVLVAGDAPISGDATTDVWTRVPASNGATAATSGVGAILATAGRLRSARATMTNANNVWIAFHNAATATTATAANMLAGPWNVSGVGAYVNYEPPIAEACTAGCKVVAWTDSTMTTIDTAATFTFYARAM